MGVPISQMWTVASYVLKQRARRNRHYPLVVMLEPLLRCNLSCAGCGKIQYPAHVLQREMEVSDAVAAVEESGAPMVSIPGGEPLMYSKIGELVRELVRRKKYIYLCTNALLLKQRLDEGVFKPSKYLTFSVHMDGDQAAHDMAVCRDGVYEKAEEAIRLAVSKGFRVTTNTTLFEHVDVERTRAFFDRMMEIGVEGMTISPGYSYEKAPDQENFLTRNRTVGLFRSLLKKARKGWRFNQSPLFLHYLMGKRHYECTPWGNPCYTIFGWQKPCYLLQEGYADSFRELIQEVEWANYGRASGNPQCANCMVHCGHEPTAVHDTFNTLGGFWATVKATLFGIDSDKGRNVEAPPVVLKTLQLQADAADLTEALSFRGDVTVTTCDGARHEGYLFNVTKDEVEMFQAGGQGVLSLRRSDVASVEKTGRDMADGRTWEEWVKRQQAKEAGAETAQAGV